MSLVGLLYLGPTANVTDVLCSGFYVEQSSVYADLPGVPLADTEVMRSVWACLAANPSTNLDSSSDLYRTLFANLRFARSGLVLCCRPIPLKASGKYLLKHLRIWRL
ncbi:MAG: hypothetical protein RIS47_2172 [Bacteroidota bacterium]|jgi:hypothetical protein